MIQLLLIDQHFFDIGKSVDSVNDAIAKYEASVSVEPSSVLLRLM